MAKKKRELLEKEGRVPKYYREQLLVEWFSQEYLLWKILREQACQWSSVGGGNPKKLMTSVVWVDLWDTSKCIDRDLMNGQWHH